MANLLPDPPSLPLPPPARTQGQESLASRGRAWILGGLDALLAEPLRRVDHSDLLRHRILVGAAGFFLLSSTLFLLRGLLGPSGMQLGPSILPTLFSFVGYLSTLVLARWGRTATAPAMVLLITLTGGFVSSVFSSKVPTSGEHAMNVLLPILAVYLMGPRRGLFITLTVIAAMGIVHPYYRAQVGIDVSTYTPVGLWAGHVFAVLAFLGAWALGSLHSTSRDAAQASLERTLKELRDSEYKLNSVLESTDDLVVSVDRRGCLLTANAAAKRAYQRHAGMGLGLGLPLFQLEAPERRAQWEARLAQVLQGHRLQVEETHELKSGRVVLDIRAHPILGERGEVLGMTLFAHDISSRRVAENRLEQMHRTLVDVSRQAGMAEVATGVLHNVGNTLNSVNISTSLVIDCLRRSRVSGLSRTAALLREHLDDIPAFIAGDPRGQQLPCYLIALAEQLQQERESALREMRALGESVEHINAIVSMQQKHARVAGAVEQVLVPQLIDEALRLNASSFEQQSIRIERDYAEVPPIFVDRHKLLQILINLMSNARHALVASAREDKYLGIHVRPAPEGAQLHIEVTDNGVGIAPENLERLFSQGFTTKKRGHGFGLHISALAAAELNGHISCRSLGPGQGATFTLALPTDKQMDEPRPPAG